MLGKPTRQAAAAEGRERSRDPNYQRVLGLALAYTDAAYSILIRCGELYHEYAREAMEGGEPFNAERTFRIYGQLMSAHKLCWEAGDLVFRAGSTTGARDGTRLQRLWRDLCAFRTNGIHQLDFRAASIAQARLGLPIDFFDRGVGAGLRPAREVAGRGEPGCRAVRTSDNGRSTKLCSWINPRRRPDRCFALAPSTWNRFATAGACSARAS